MMRISNQERNTLMSLPIVQYLSVPRERRIIAISDIHGCLDTFREILAKVGFSAEDELFLVGDLFLKGPQPEETFHYIYDELRPLSNVHILRGNCDWKFDYMEDAAGEWIDGLPNIIETEDWIFVHGGLPSRDYTAFDAYSCMKFDNYIEKTPGFDKWQIVGHFPVEHFCHEIACCNPFISEEKRVIGIDGGMGVRGDAQMNALLIQNGEVGFAAVDPLPKMIVEKAQDATENPINITWEERYVERLEDRGEVALWRHVKSGRELELPYGVVWPDQEGNTFVGPGGTDYFLPLSPGDEVGVVKRFSDRILAKKDGFVGWVRL